DDALRVGVGEAHACERRVAERRLASGHVPELDHPGDPSHVKQVPGTSGTWYLAWELLPDHAEDLVALPLHQPLRARLEVEAQERLRVRRAHVEVPAVRLDGEPVEVRDLPFGAE